MHVCVFKQMCVLSLRQGISDGSVSRTHIRGTSAHNLSGLANPGSHILTHAVTHTHSHTICLGSMSLALIPLSELLPCYTPNTQIDHIHMPTAGHSRSLWAWFLSLSLSLAPSLFLSLSLTLSSTISPAPGLSLSLSSHPRE